jgi:RNA polymerase sporulation-specific sigma factor
MKAREKFIQGNLRLVLSVIQRFNNRGETADDLFQVGCVGLIKAIDNFDINQEVQFSTYRSTDDNWRNKEIFKR